VLSPAEEAIARSEASELWRALSAEDTAGAVTRNMEANPPRAADYTSTLRNSETAAVADITGSTWIEETPTPAPRLVRSVFPALVVINVVGVYLGYREGGKWGAFYAVADPLGVVRSNRMFMPCGGTCRGPEA
jgi:hypothetical protein